MLETRSAIAALIPAHNEAAVLSLTLASLRAAAPPPATIIVIADHCIDATLAIAEQNGALVLQRDEGERGKGQALRWLFERYPSALAACPISVIFDADSQVSPNFFAEVQACFAQGVQAAQSFVQPVNDETSPAAALAAYSEVLSQVVDDALRAQFGWPVPFRGTGMALQTDLLRDLLPQVQTLTEDIELSILLAERGAVPKFLCEAIVYDPKPLGATQVARQRARWLQGQLQVWQHYAVRLARLLARGPGVWWLLSALLLKPKTLFVALKLAVCLLALVLPVSPWIKVAFAALVIGEIIYYLAGLAWVRALDRRRYAQALFYAPLYLGMWVLSALKAAQARSGWLSVRHE